jgi:hypothetical protein
MKWKWSGKHLFFGRLIFDLILCSWQVMLIKASGKAPETPFFADPMFILAVTNPAVTLLSTTAFSSAVVAREWIWVLLYLISNVVIWGGLWIILRWLNAPSAK